MDFGVTFQTDPPASRIVELTQRAERLGFTHAWTFDSHILWQEPYVIYAQMLAATDKIMVGPFVTNPATRDPTVTGSLFATLNDMFGNRTVCGIGRGDSSRRVLGRPPTTLAQTEAAIHIIKDLAEGREIDTPAGKVKIPWVRDGRLEVWMAAYGPKALAVCGRAADGFILQLADPDITRWTIAKVREAATEAGRDPDAITPALQALVVVAPTEAEARAMLDARAVRFFGLLLPAETWRAFGLRHPLGDHFGGFVDLVPEAYDRPTVEAAIAAVPREMVEGQMFWGTPAQVVARLRAFGEAGLRYVTPALVSAAVSPEAASYSVQAMAEIAHALRSGEWTGKQAA
jgi:probable F420-dependent oxidoreductase